MLDSTISATQTVCCGAAQRGSPGSGANEVSRSATAPIGGSSRFSSENSPNTNPTSSTLPYTVACGICCSCDISRKTPKPQANPRPEIAYRRLRALVFTGLSGISKRRQHRAQRAISLPFSVAAQTVLLRELRQVFSVHVRFPRRARDVARMPAQQPAHVTPLELGLPDLARLTVALR